MLKGISPLISPELLSAMHRMGHGDEILFADAHFPGESLSANVIRADGLSVAALLDAILPLFEIDAYVEQPILMMSAVEGDVLDPTVEAGYLQTIKVHCPKAPGIKRVDRFSFYKRASGAFAIVMTGETAKYGNIMLTKGVTPS